jgi:hypothetical protein
MKRLLLVLTAALAMWVQGATAAVLVSLDSVGSAGPGLFRWTYRADLQPDQTLQEDQFFTIYDIPSFISATFDTSLNEAVEGRTFDVDLALLGRNALGTNLGNVDDPDIWNITVTLDDGDTIEPSAGPVTLGNLFVISTADRNLRALTDYGSQNTLNGNLAANVGKVLVPIPELSSVAMMMAGLIAVGAFHFRRRRIDE